MLGDRLGGDRFRILIVGMLRDGMRLIRRCQLILRGGIVQRHIGRSLMRRGARLLRPLLVHEPNPLNALVNIERSSDTRCVMAASRDCSSAMRP